MHNMFGIWEQGWDCKKNIIYPSDETQTVEDFYNRISDSTMFAVPKDYITSKKKNCVICSCSNKFGADCDSCVFDNV